MESLIAKMNDLYEKEIQNRNKKENSPNIKDKKYLIEKVYIIDKNNLNGEEKLIKINNKDNLPSFKNEKEIKTFIEKNDIPINNINKMIKEIFKYNNKDLIIKFMQKNKDKLTEKHLVIIFKKIQEFDIKKINDIIKYIFNNILIDEKYFLELLKEEKLDLNKEIIESMNNNLSNLKFEQNKINVVGLIKTLNLTSLIKEIIGKEEYDSYEKKINEIIDLELDKRENKKDRENEFDEDFNMDFINSMKIINSNPNKAYFIQEKIII